MINKEEFSFNPRKTTLIKYLGKDVEITVPFSVKSISNGAFADSKVTKISFQSGSAYEKIEYESLKCKTLKEIDFTNAPVKGISEQTMARFGKKVKIVGVSRQYKSNLEDEELRESKTGNCCATVCFEDGRSYKYFCPFPVKEGDFVSVEGKYEGTTGIVKCLEPYFNASSFELCNVTEIVSKPKKADKEKLETALANSTKKEICIFTRDTSKNACIYAKINGQYRECNCFGDVSLSDKVEILMEDATLFESIVDGIKEKPLNAEYREFKEEYQNEEETLLLYEDETIREFIPRVVKINGEAIITAQKLKELLEEVKQENIKKENILKNHFSKDFMMANFDESQPLLLDDDYPFGYTINKPLNIVINNARLGSKAAIQQLIDIYNVSLLKDDKKEKQLKEKNIESFSWLVGGTTEKKKIAYWQNKMNSQDNGVKEKDAFVKYEKNINTLNAGEKIVFGNYNDTPLTWTVLDKQSDCILALCDLSLFTVKNTTIWNHQWESAEYLKILNNQIKKTIFNDNEIKCICSCDEQSSDDKHNNALEHNIPFDLRILTEEEYQRYKKLIPSGYNWAILYTNKEEYENDESIKMRCIAETGDTAVGFCDRMGIRPVACLRKGE